MARKHVLIVSLLLGFATAAGALAAVRTAHLGQASTSTATSKISERALLNHRRALNKTEASLRRALASRPPKLPKIPSYPAPPVQAASGPAASPMLATAAPPAVRYVRPAPIVVVTHRPHGDGEDHGHDGGGGDD